MRDEDGFSDSIGDWRIGMHLGQIQGLEVKLVEGSTSWYNQNFKESLVYV